MPKPNTKEPKYKSIKVTHPHKAAFWHPTKNRHSGLSPTSVTYGSNFAVWWQCTSNPKHEWQMRIIQFLSRLTDCQFCLLEQSLPSASLKERFPSLAKQWDFAMNEVFEPHNVAWDSHRCVYWKCEAGHSWSCAISERTRSGVNCPFCSENDPPEDPLTSYKEISRQWHPSKNRGLDKSQLSAKSTILVWWRCKYNRDHEWQERISTRINHGTDCQKCTRDWTSHRVGSLRDVFPEIAREWHPTKNGDLSPSEVAAHSVRVAWWRCKRMHEWQSTVGKRTDKLSGCPYCTKQRPSELYSLKKQFPKIARQWHPTKNGDLRPEQVMPTTLRRAWWICFEDSSHEWESVICDRTSAGTGCPFCAGVRVCASNSLENVFPELAKQWHPTKNGKLKPGDIVFGSAKQIWWQCDLGHTWRAAAYNRAEGTGCPSCAQWRVSSSKESLAGKYPKVARLWHPSRNGKLEPSMIKPGSSQVIWWQCHKDTTHQWQAKVGALTLRGRGCPQCKTEVIKKKKSLSALFPAIAAEWITKRNEQLSPETVTAFSGKVVWWRCSRNKKHEWQSTVKFRTTGDGSCPHCKQASETLSIKSPEIAELWHPGRNGKKAPHSVSAYSSEVVWWKCRKNQKHVWSNEIKEQARTGPVCPLCPKVSAVRTKSVAQMNRAIAKQWHPTKNEGLRPEDIGAGSDRKVWWKCTEGPDHEWQATIFQRTHLKTACPFCSNRRASITNCLKTLYPKVAQQWHPTKNGDAKPRMVLAESSKKFWWKCKSGHVWQARIQDRTVRGTGCLKCHRLGISQS